MLKFDHYHLSANDTLTVFEFVSEGPKGRIDKIVQISKTGIDGVFNLGLADKLSSTEIDDTAISNNGDSQKILATVVATVYAFTKRNPKAWIFATGNTRARVRLYRIGLSNNLDEISRDFEIYGLKDGELISFTKDLDCDAFVARRK
ncbi:hypothetical protein BH10ACI2_BH10ACI2_23360 [soil metagenome]